MSLSGSQSDEDIAINTFVRPTSINRALSGLKKYNERTPPRETHTVHHYPANITVERELPRTPSPIDINSDPFVEHNNQPITMALDLNLLRFRLAAINTYNGNPEGLNNFIFSCQQVTNHYLNLDEKSTIIMHLKSKLLERASLQLGTRNYVTYDDFYVDLRQSFSLGKDLNSYRSDIIHAYKKREQTTLDFAYDVRKLLDLAYDFVQSSNYSPEEKITIRRELDHVAIERIITACHHDLQRYFFCIQPTEISVVIREIQRDMAFVQRNRQRIHENNDRIQTRPEPTRPLPRALPHLPQPSYPCRQNSNTNFPPRQFKPNFPQEQRTFQRPQQFNQQRPNNNTPASGRYANSHVIRNAYPPPNTSRPNNNQVQRNFVPSNRYQQQNNFNPFNRPPPRPMAPQPPTPMEINTHGNEYDHYDNYYPEDTYETYENNCGYFYDEYQPEYYQGNQHNSYDNETENTQYITNNMSTMQIKDDFKSSENVNFTTEASETKATP